MKHKPEDVFRLEKERAQTSRNSQHARLLAEAKAAFDKLMAEGQAARKSGRPRLVAMYHELGHHFCGHVGETIGQAFHDKDARLEAEADRFAETATA